jgi:hypothetical protein
MPIEQVQLTDERWLQFWRHYRGLEHQEAAVIKLGQQIKQSDPGLLTESADWVNDWRSPVLSNPATNTWEGVEAAAKAAGARWHSLVAAQWALESGWGKHAPGHNYFGLKGPGASRTTREVVNGKTITITDEFLNFHSLDECVGYLVDRWYRDFTANGKIYRGVNHCSSAEVAARELQRQGYATNPRYADLLIDLLRKHRPSQGEALPRNPLNVRWQSQLDNKSGQGYRECFSTSCAILASFWGKVLDGDDAYNAVRKKYGDTTSAEAQLAALRSLGLRADFHTNGNPKILEEEINAGRPVAVGWLHKGPVATPSGTGHWSVVIGYSAEQRAWIHHDPNGEANLVGGGYVNNTKGAGVAYSYKNWNPRWMVNGTGGWYLTCRP